MTICEFCDQDYFLNNNQCFYSPFCERYRTGNGLCIYCKQAFDFLITLVETSDGLHAQCVKSLENNHCIHTIDGICVECQDPFVLIKETKLCIPETQALEFCIVATSSNLTCIECIEDYGLVNHKFVKVGGSCQLRQQCYFDSCTICDSNPSILCSTSCKAGYKLSSSGICMYECPTGELEKKSEGCTVSCLEGTSINSDKLYSLIFVKQSCNKNSIEEQNNNLVIIIGGLCGGIGTIAIGVIIFKIYLKRRRMSVIPSISIPTQREVQMDAKVEINEKNKNQLFQRNKKNQNEFSQIELQKNNQSKLSNKMQIIKQEKEQDYQLEVEREMILMNV